MGPHMYLQQAILHEKPKVNLHNAIIKSGIVDSHQVSTGRHVSSLSISGSSTPSCRWLRPIQPSVYLSIYAYQHMLPSWLHHHIYYIYTNIYIHTYTWHIHIDIHIGSMLTQLSFSSSTPGPLRKCTRGFHPGEGPGELLNRVYHYTYNCVYIYICTRVYIYICILYS